MMTMDQFRLHLHDEVGCATTRQFGCTAEDVEGVEAYVREQFPTHPVSIVEDWYYLNVHVSHSINVELEAAGAKPAFLVAGRMISDDQLRDRFGTNIRTSLLKGFHGGCIFVTRNTAYILVGPGHQTTVSSGFAKKLFAVDPFRKFRIDYLRTS